MAMDRVPTTISLVANRGSAPDPVPQALPNTRSKYTIKLPIQNGYRRMPERTRDCTVADTTNKTVAQRRSDTDMDANCGTNTKMGHGRVREKGATQLATHNTHASGVVSTDGQGTCHVRNERNDHVHRRSGR